MIYIYISTEYVSKFHPTSYTQFAGWWCKHITIPKIQIKYGKSGSSLQVRWNNPNPLNRWQWMCIPGIPGLYIGELWLVTMGFDWFRPIHIVTNPHFCLWHAFKHKAMNFQFRDDCQVKHDNHDSKQHGFLANSTWLCIWNGKWVLYQYLIIAKPNYIWVISAICWLSWAQHHLRNVFVKTWSIPKSIGDHWCIKFN